MSANDFLWLHGMISHIRLYCHMCRLCELVWWDHDISWHVTKVTMLNWKIFGDLWWFNIMTFDEIKNHQRSSENVTKCHEIKIIKNHWKSFNSTWWHFMTYGDIWWPLMTFDDFSWQNHVLYHDMSWHVMICHDISPTNSERHLQGAPRVIRWCEDIWKAYKRSYC